MHSLQSAAVAAARRRWPSRCRRAMTSRLTYVEEDDDRDRPLERTVSRQTSKRVKKWVRTLGKLLEPHQSVVRRLNKLNVSLPTVHT